MSLTDRLPAELLLNLPTYLHSIEDLYSLYSTCRTLYHTCANPDPKVIPRLAANSGRSFFRPHPHLLIAATARQVADWAVMHDDHRYLLEEAIQGGVDKLLELALDVAELCMDDIRRLYTYKRDVLNPLNRRLDLAAGPRIPDSRITVCNDPETTLLSWVIYGELFHHSLELTYLPMPQYKPLSSITRYKWLVYCVPDVNSFDRMGFVDTPRFFQNYVQEDDDQYQQLSMAEATRQLLSPFLWRSALEASPPAPVASGAVYASIAMHMGMKSLELLLPGGPERLREDLDQIASGIVATADEGTLLEFSDDPWLACSRVYLISDLHFTLWGSWEGDADLDSIDLLKEAIRRPPQRKKRFTIASNV